MRGDLLHWQELEPGPDLNRAVAERLGWSVRRIVPGRQVRYQLIRPDGSVEGTYNAERDAWMEVPSFSTRLDSALGLVEAADAELMLRRIPGVGRTASTGPTPRPSSCGPGWPCRTN